ncbi:MAG: hypothetical protein ACRETQ_11030 [Gammaproteobacteria bacterium]
MKSPISLLAFGFLLGPFMLPQAQALDAPLTAPTIKLGTVTVTGEAKVVQALEAIKRALTQPESSDPKLANVVVCRIHDDIGSHLNRVLTCATNHTLTQRHDITQQGWWTGQMQMQDGGGMPAFVTVMNEYLKSMPQNILKMSVNGPAFHALLQKLPPPTADVYLYRTRAPAGSTQQRPANLG